MWQEILTIAVYYGKTEALLALLMRQLITPLQVEIKLSYKTRLMEGHREESFFGRPQIQTGVLIWHNQVRQEVYLMAMRVAHFQGKLTTI